jgi:hypothetical protein
LGLIDRDQMVAGPVDRARHRSCGFAGTRLIRRLMGDWFTTWNFDAFDRQVARRLPVWA